MQVRYYLTLTLERRSEPRERLFLAGCTCAHDAIANIPDCRLIENAMVWRLLWPKETTLAFALLTIIAIP